jgi:hypothetical protein
VDRGAAWSGVVAKRRFGSSGIREIDRDQVPPRKEAVRIRVGAEVSPRTREQPHVDPVPFEFSRNRTAGVR